MSKVDDLRNKYPYIKIPIFDKFLLADRTETKKYLEYYLKMWDGKDELERFMRGVTTKTLIDTVNKFNELLPYISCKDIYNTIYTDFTFLKDTVINASKEREDKQFDKKEHVHVILDTETFIMVYLKTHKGSLKYGAGTKWCTASKGNESIFKRYIARGGLAYLITKTDIKENNFKKVAFRTDGKDHLSTELEIYNSNDTRITEREMIDKGWSVEDVQLAMISYRVFTFNLEKVKKAKSDIEKVVNMFKNFDSVDLIENMKIIGQEINENDDFITDIKKSISKFTNFTKNFGI